MGTTNPGHKCIRNVLDSPYQHHRIHKQSKPKPHHRRLALYGSFEVNQCGRGERKGGEGKSEQ